MTVTVDTEKCTLEIPDIGVTVRTLLAAAADGYEKNGRRKWDIVYKHVPIGSIRVKTDRIVKRQRSTV